MWLPEDVGTRVEKWPIGPLGREEGFTAFELLIAVTTIVILAAVGMPLFLELIQTYRLNAGTRQTVAQIRRVQSLAVSRGSTFGFHWGGDPNLPPPGRLNSEYRIERDATGACGYPLPTDTTANPDVITEWTDLTQDYTGVIITSIQDTNGTPLGGVMFNSRGASVNTCTGVAFPVTVTVADATGATRTIRVRSAGSLRICPCP
ncbi:MAG: Tfp pilus assembly protein FimT/FimU [Candidatus Methylomirabilales bacterium]